MELHIPKNLLALNYLLFKKLLTAFAVYVVFVVNGAENEARTRDPHLGKVVLYH